MDQEEREMLEETHALALQNNKLLKSMKRNARAGAIAKILLWGIMIGVPVWFYINFLSPVIDQLGATMDQVRSTGAQLQETGAKLRDATESAQPAVDLAGDAAEKLQGVIDLLPF